MAGYPQGKPSGYGVERHPDLQPGEQLGARARINEPGRVRRAFRRAVKLTTLPEQAGQHGQRIAERDPETDDEQKRQVR